MPHKIDNEITLLISYICNIHSYEKNCKLDPYTVHNFKLFVPGNGVLGLYILYK